jgi:Flp pilus assembly pilin Flp
LPLWNRLTKFTADERAVTAIEYAMIAVMISISVIAGARLIGINISANFLGPLASAFP